MSLVTKFIELADSMCNVVGFDHKSTATMYIPFPVWHQLQLEAKQLHPRNELPTDEIVFIGFLHVRPENGKDNPER